MPDALTSFLPHDSVAGKLLHHFEWGASSLPHFAAWPIEVKVRMQSMLRSEHPMFLAWGKNLSIFFNDRFLPFTAGPADFGVSLYDFWLTRDTEVLTMIERVMSSEETVQLKSPIHRIDSGTNTQSIHSITLLPIFNTQGATDGVMGIVEKSEQENRSIANSHHVDTFEELANTLPVMVWKTDSSGYCTYLNARWYDYTGQSPATGLGKGWLDVVHPEDSDSSRQTFMEAVEHKRSFSLIYRIRNKENQYHWAIDMGSPVLDKEDVLLGFVGTVVDIHERKLAEEKLLEEKSAFTQIANALPQIIWTAGPEGYVDYYNDRWYQATGAERGYGDESFLPILHPEDREYCLQTWYHSVRNGAPYEIEYRFQDAKRPGEYRWYLGRAQPIRDSSGTIVKWFGSCTDIHDSKLAKEALQESEQRFRTVADSAPVMIWMVDEENNTTFFNKGWLDFRQRTFEEEKLGWVEGIHPDDRASAVDTCTKAFLARQEFHTEFRMLRHNGQYRWVSDDAVPRFGPNGKFEGYIGVCMDIQQRKDWAQEMQKQVDERTEQLQVMNQELTQEKEFAMALMDASVDVIGVYDTEMRFVTLNKKCELLFGVNREEIKGKTLQEVFPESKGTQAERDLQQALQGEYIHNEVFGSHSSPHVFENFIIPLRNHAGEIYGAMVLGHEITTMIEARKVLEQTNAKLERSNKELEEFAYVTSHDLQEPLRKIQTFSEFLREHLEDKTRANFYLEKIITSSARMSMLIRDVLNYSRISNEQDNRKPVNLTMVLKDILDDYELLIDQKKAEVEFSDLPIVEGIPQQMYQLFSNLLGNSLKFTNGHPLIEVTSTDASIEEVRVHRLDESVSYAKIIFKDNGIGFEQQYARQIFTIFQRLNNSTLYGGTGIGLALCKKIAETHGGAIYAHSAIGQGASFHIILPHARN